MSDNTDRLYALVEDAARDIVFDHVNYDTPTKTEIQDITVHEREADEDDGTVFGTYRISVNGERFVIELEASARYAGFTDCWNWSSEAHYTRDVYFDELEDFEYKVLKFVEINQAAIDKAIDADIESTKEARP